MKNRMTGKCPFDVVYLESPNHLLDLVPLPKTPGNSKAAKNLAKRIQKTTSDVRKHIEKANVKTKTRVDSKRREKVFKRVVR